MFLSPSSPRRIASIINKAPNPLPQRSASGQEIQVLPGATPTFASKLALQSTLTPLKSPRSRSSQPTARHGTRITRVTSAPTHHFRRRARSVHHLGYHHICPPQVGRRRQRNKIFGIDPDAISILLVLNGTPLTTVLLRGLSSLRPTPNSGPPCLTALRVPRQAQG